MYRNRAIPQSIASPAKQFMAISSSVVMHIMSPSAIQVVGGEPAMGIHNLSLHANLLRLVVVQVRIRACLYCR